LDLACGKGRHSFIYLNQLGFDVLGATPIKKQSVIKVHDMRDHLRKNTMLFLIYSPALATLKTMRTTLQR
jgi:hypothetical protein